MWAPTNCIDLVEGTGQGIWGLVDLLLYGDRIALYLKKSSDNSFLRRKRGGISRYVSYREEGRLPETVELF